MVLVAAVFTVAPAAWATAGSLLLQGAGSQEPDGEEEAQELAQLLAEERLECDRLRRLGEARAAERRLTELLDEQADDHEARVIRGRARLDQAAYDTARADFERVLKEAPSATAPAGAEVRAAAARGLAELCSTLGATAEAVEVLEGQRTALNPALNPAVDARDAWALGNALWEDGRRKEAREQLAIGAATGVDQGYEGLLAKARCQRRLGQLEAASQSCVAASEVARAGDGEEPDVLAFLGELYFEADKEVAEGRSRSAANLFREALQLHATHEAALLGLHALHRTNWLRQRQSSAEFLNAALSARPTSITTLLVAAGVDLDDGQLKSARERLEVLERVAPARRGVSTLRAALHAIESDTPACETLLAASTAHDALDSTPEREVGRHLLELYRFAEGLPYLRRAVERDPADYEAWTQLGRALANTGDEPAARKALEEAQRAAAGRQDAWRNNTLLVLKRIEERHTRRTHGDLSFSWEPAGDEVLSTYLIPFYADARAELAKRYSFTPSPTLIEVFSRHKDFSVRSTGFEGFPALGVCFGPVVTAVSPLWEQRGTQSWARTSFHEFTHVIHLGLSRNRCPRWITEGLATWEEVNKNPAWTRNMRRELLDSLANDALIRVRDMNGAFRSQRILFGYYQSGLICQMLIEKYGFPPLVRLLSAFDRGLDLDQAFADVYAVTPEQLDREFRVFTERMVGALKIEPRWSRATIERLRATTSTSMPSEAAARARWAENWTALARAAWQDGRRVDAQEALRMLKDVEPELPKTSLLRGEIALEAGDADAARVFWARVLESGADDFNLRLSLATLAEAAGDTALAEENLRAAERCFPGFDDPGAIDGKGQISATGRSAELRLVRLLRAAERHDEAFEVLERWIAWNAGDVKLRLELARWHRDAGRAARASVLYEEINEVDPFLRALHQEWADVLRAEKRHEEALREYRVASLVPAALDALDSRPWSDEERAAVIAGEAASLAELGRNDEARAKAREALALDDDQEVAEAVLEKVD